MAAQAIEYIIKQMDQPYKYGTFWYNSPLHGIDHTNRHRIFNLTKLYTDALMLMHKEKLEEFPVVRASYNVAEMFNSIEEAIALHPICEHDTFGKEMKKEYERHLKALCCEGHLVHISNMLHQIHKKDEWQLLI